MRRNTLRNLAALAGTAIATRALVRRVRAYDLRNKVVLVTGGSRGLGLVLARQLADRGAKLAICARTTEQLARARDELIARGATVFAATCDVSDPQQTGVLVDRVRAALGPIDVLINNAGIIQVGPIEAMTMADYEQAMAVHFWGPLRLIQTCLPDVARIVNIASIGGRVAVPHLAPYAASKFALVGLSEAMRVELAAKGIAVTTVIPGLMRTGSARNAQFKGRHRAEYAWFAIGAATPLLTIGDTRAAKQIIDALRHGDPEVVLSLPAKLAVRAAAIAPGFVQRVLTLVDRALPDGDDPEIHTGAESESSLAPSRWTTLGDRAARRNNEL